jgi:putative flippase GtrA
VSAVASIRHESLRFVAVGLFLLAVDATAFATLHALGVPTGIANLIARFIGTVLGFWLHGRITFGGGRPAPMGHRQMGRYVLVWCALTALSTAALAGWEAAFLSFFALRHFVYRP